MTDQPLSANIFLWVHLF